MVLHTKKKSPKFPMKLLTVSILSLHTYSSMAAETVNISQTPLSGVSIIYQPNITLVPSIEYPTAGAAYSGNEYQNTSPFLKGRGEENVLLLKKSDAHNGLLGYFDPTKCYTFEGDDAKAPLGESSVGYFRATSEANADGSCKNTKEFSGSVINWGTMSAVDIFRKVLTGGNRAFGTKADSSAYAERADRVTLRRAMFNESRWHAVYRTRMRIRGIEFDKNIVSKYFPESVVNTLMLDQVKGINYTQVGLPGAMGFKVIKDSGELTDISVSGLVANQFVDGNLYFHNYGFSTVLVRLVKYYDSRSGMQTWTYAWQDLDSIRANYKFSSLINELIANRNKYKAAGSLKNRYMPVVVQVCDSNTGEDLNMCVSYGSAKKPEGLIQPIARRGARFATFSYLNTRSDDVDGGVLRSPMKYLIAQSGSGSANEWDVNTGVLALNPEGASEGNSGVINFLNKFGDRSGYKDTDPSSELYYAAMRYLRIGDSHITNGAVYLPSNITEAQKDGFPVQRTWRDPLKSDFDTDSKEPMCRPNMIMWIGDTNTHYDNNLPNWNPGGGRANVGRNWSSAISDDRELKTEDMFKRILKSEGRERDPMGWDRNRGLWEQINDRGHSPGGVAGLAYWAHINDTRDDIPGNQFQSNFIIDVLEDGNPKENNEYRADNPSNTRLSDGNRKFNSGNPYYWAAKYGGFTTGGTVESNIKITDPNQDPQSWKGAATSNELRLFPKGMPNNFAIANNPTNMTNALTKAFSSTGTFVKPSQAAPTFTNVPGQSVDLSPGQTTRIISTTYDFTNLTGDVVAEDYYLDTSTGSLKAKDNKVWVANAELEQAYHTSNYTNRKVYTRDKNNNFVPFNTANKSNFLAAVGGRGRLTEDDVINYVLGDPSKEDAQDKYARVRKKGILGTLVSPTVAMVHPLPVNSKARAQGCTYATPIENRQDAYVVSANDGMVHILNNNGQEEMALMLSSAVPSLSEYAQPGYIHKYLNDGTPIVAEVCTGSTSTPNREARSIAVGSAGKGGAAIYAIDVTDTSNITSNNLLWEFTGQDDAGFGIAAGVPSVAKTGEGKAIAIMSSGYNNSTNDGSIFILDLNKPKGTAWIQGSNYIKVQLRDANTGVTSPSGVGDVRVYDSNNDGVPDKLYVGDYNGNLWRIKYTASADNNGLGTWDVSLLYKAPAGAPPITTKPDVHNDYVIVGTGQYMTSDALDKKQQNYAYGFIDTGETIDGMGALLEQSIDKNVTAQTDLDKVGASGWTITRNEMQSNHKGWYLKLPLGQIVSSDANVYRGKVAQFQSVARTDETNVCTPTGSTSFISVDLKNGGLYRAPIYDTNFDGKYDDKDVNIGMMTYKDNIAPTKGSVGATVNGRNTTAVVALGTKRTISFLINPLGDDPILRRLSWREIF